MITKITRKNCLDRYPVFPLRNYDPSTDEETFFYPAVFKSYLLTLPAKSLKGYVRLLGTQLAQLIKALNFSSLIFLGDTATPWLYQDNDYPPVRRAMQFLTDHQLGKKFNGGLKVEPQGLSLFIPHLCWLSRGNAALPYFYFTDEDQNITGHICKYGNLHLDTLNENTDKLLQRELPRSKFQYASGCYNQFGKTSAIRGRQTII